MLAVNPALAIGGLCAHSIGHNPPSNAADNEYDRVSNLDRPGIYRLNMGVSKNTFHALFGVERINVTDYDFTALDKIMPHPEYARQYFVCVLSPGAETWQTTERLLAEAYDLAVKRQTRRQPTVDQEEK